MGSHEENMKDPVWLAEQIGRYKQETATLQAQHDAYCEKAKALEVQRDTAAATINRVEALLASERQRAEELSAKCTTLNKSLAEATKELQRVSVLASSRKTALADVMQAVATVTEKVLPLLSSE